MRKLTQEEWINHITKVNPHVVVLGEIQNGSTSVLCKCKVCGWEWKQRPSILKMGHGCPKCSGKVKVPGQYEEEVFKVQPYVKPLKPFTKCCDKVPCECLVCGNVWNACPESLKAGYGCPKCGDTRIPHEKQVKIIEEANPKVKVIGRVASNTKSVECLCLQCGHIWKAKPFNLKRKKPSGCPKCAKSGFNSFRESWLYVLVDDLEIPTQMKIGITNNLEGRLSVLRRHTPFQFHVVKTYSFEPGYDAKSLEKLVHTIFHYLNCGYTNFDGATEWFWYSHNILDFLEDNC